MKDKEPVSLCIALERELRHRRLSGKTKPYTGTRSENYRHLFENAYNSDDVPGIKAGKMAKIILDAQQRGYWIRDYVDIFKTFCEEHEL